MFAPLLSLWSILQGRIIIPPSAMTRQYISAIVGGRIGTPKVTLFYSPACIACKVVKRKVDAMCSKIVDVEYERINLGNKMIRDEHPDVNVVPTVHYVDPVGRSYEFQGMDATLKLKRLLLPVDRPEAGRGKAEDGTKFRAAEGGDLATRGRGSFASDDRPEAG